MSNSPDLAGTPSVWVKSTYSGGEGGNCVEWAPTHAATHGLVPVRDSKTPDGPALTFTPTAWATFVTALRADELPGA
ncbi:MULTISPECIES: DUF397 domain-containing protein [unclassified Streptomyces]|uniref:DUF397 domain-containing protein n=1 Tax=unclassified Streptomyces TaxID=2593676 RepID=UPI002E29CC66|nr:DUF397 domain-containing protein [Streptomyces sp. NBC_00223]